MEAMMNYVPRSDANRWGFGRRIHVPKIIVERVRAGARAAVAGLSVSGTPTIESGQVFSTAPGCNLYSQAESGGFAKPLAPAIPFRTMQMFVRYVVRDNSQHECVGWTLIG